MKVTSTRFVLFVSVFGAIQAAPSIRMPNMPRGLSADKSVTSKHKVAANEERKPVRKRKPWQRLSLGNKRRTLSTMNFQELTKAKDDHMAKGHLDTAAIFLQRMITLCENVSEKANLIIELANIHFTQQNYAEAKKQYQEFERLYPGNQLIEHAKKQIILCTKQTILSPDRDQSPTQETLRLAEEYLDRESFKLYRDEIEKVKKECEGILAESECGITEFYIKQGNFQCAQKRIDHIRTTWLEKVPEVETALAKLEVHLGTEWKEFSIPESSIKLAEASHIKEKPMKKADMTARF